MKIFFTVILLFFIEIASAQSLTGFLIDNNSQKAIADVEIKDITNNKIYFSGSNGSFDIPYNGKRKIVLKITHIGYKSATLSFDYGQTNEVILLQSSDNQITPIVVEGKRILRESNIIIDYLEIEDESFISLANSSIDNDIRYLSKINIIRPQGIFTNSPIIGMQGMSDVPGRTLVLYDGIRLNKADDGNVNWNMFPPSIIENVQISNSAQSSTLGNNAMGGVIAFSPYLPEKQGFHGFVKAHYGDYGTFGSEIGTSYKHKGITGFFANFDVFGQISNGYIATPDSLQLADIEYVTTDLQEGKVNLIFGYDFNASNSLKFTFNYFDDFRGLGTKINEEKGSYTKHTSEFATINYKGATKRIKYGVDFAFQNENYFKNIESIKKGNYSLIYVNSLRQDFSNNFYANFNFFKHYNFLSGINIAMGQVEGRDNYQTSSDIVINAGKVLRGEYYLQNNFKFLKNDALKLNLGANYSFSYIKLPKFIIENQTSATDFMSDFTGIQSDNIFKDFSYNTNISYSFKKYVSLFASTSTGYNAPTLDDLTRSGLMRQGFKLANPNLTSEKITDFSSGLNFNFWKLTGNVQGYYKLGNDFMYYVETGEAIFGGRKKIIQKQNVTNVDIYGVNAGLNFTLKNFKLFANYTYNNSSIKKFDSIPDLEGKQLSYSPLHSAHCGINVTFNKFDFILAGNYFSEQFSDNYNTIKIPDFYTLDFTVKAEVLKNTFIEYSVQNILDYQYIIYNDQLSIGRFSLLSLKYKW